MGCSKGEELNVKSQGLYLFPSVKKKEKRQPFLPSGQLHVENLCGILKVKKMGKFWTFYTVGIIHSANVRTVNLEKSCVSVEWTEGGATKGKEVSSVKMPLPHLAPYSL